MTPRDAAALLALATLWGGSYLCIRVAVPAFGPAALVAARVAIGAAFLLAFARLTRRPLVLRPHAARLVVLGLLNAALPYVLISAAELRLTASFAAVLTATVPLFAAPFGALWLGERLTPRRVAGLAAGVVGVAVMVGWSPAPLTAPTLLAIAALLAASASYAGAGIYARLALRGVPTHTLALGQQLGALAWLAVPGLVWAPRHVPPAPALWATLALGALSTGVAYLLYFRLLERLGPTGTSTVTYLLPVAGLLWGAALLGEPVTAGLIAGLALVLASVVLVNEVRVGALLQALRAKLRAGAVRVARTSAT
ncbi:MAG TPA: DMT family transporter [Gemmatimonadales bacterium]|nr:DMT family transporter [Gemmatimonadales bacterium]